MTLFKKVLQLSAIIVLISALFCCGKGSAKSANDIDLIHFNSATELARSIRRGEITSVDLLNLYLDRIQRYNDDINAVVALDITAARARAAEADKALAQGQEWGPLHGVPITVKDVFEVVGMPTTSGDPALKGHIPKRHAIAVQRLIDADVLAILQRTVGKLHSAGLDIDGAARPDIGLDEMNFIYSDNRSQIRGPDNHSLRSKFV